MSKYGGQVPNLPKLTTGSAEFREQKLTRDRFIYRWGQTKFACPQGELMKKLTRSNKEKMIAGVCGGMAEYFDMDPTIVRLIYVIVSIFSVAFPGILVYFILWIILPKKETIYN